MAHKGADDTSSEFGAMFESAPEIGQAGSSTAGSSTQRAGGTTAGVRTSASTGVTREQREVRTGFGRGPLTVDKRKYKYDVNRALESPEVDWNSSKADRMDPEDAGLMLHEIHEMFGIHKETESRLLAFDRALWHEHTINGASQLQPGRGYITVDGQKFSIDAIVTKLGVSLRRFFRAYADDIAAANQLVLDSYDAYNHESVEKAAHIRMIALKRGLQKFPHLAHDSAEAGTLLSGEEAVALVNSKRYYIPSVENNADAMVDVVRQGGELNG